MMKCACGFVPESARYGGRVELNAHRRTCDAFWRSVHQEMKRISTILYGKATAISMSEWNRYRNPDFPSWWGMRYWGKEWNDVQLESGLGVSSRGTGSLMAKGIIADDSVLYRRLDEMALADGIASGDTEHYEAMKYRVGLPICEATYLRTGRMFVR